MVEFTKVVIATFAIILSLILGSFISFGTKFTATYIYEDASTLPVGCTKLEEKNSCLPGNFTETYGFPIQYATTNFEIGPETTDPEDGPARHVNAMDSFSWPKFMLNSLIWAAAVLAIMVIFSITWRLLKKGFRK